jgi:uncharacterized protein YqeY
MEENMDLKTQLQNALKDAMRSGNEVEKNTLRLVISSIRLTEVDKGITLDDAGVMAILHKEVKSRNEAITEAQRANRPDLVASNEAEIKVLERFLPKGLSAQELDELARLVISETGATSPREMGAVMKVLIPRLEGRATGDQASQAVRKLLQE